MLREAAVIMYEKYEKHDLAIYAGYVKSEDELRKSSSGGIVTALAKQVIDDGGYVAGVAYSEDYHCAEYILVKEKAQLEKMRGSKYVEPKKNNIFSDVKALIDKGEKVLFTGLPCIVAALYSFIGARPDNLLTCELVCKGPTLQKVHEQYVLYLENKYKSKIKNFSVRYKKYGWIPPYLYAEFYNGKVFEREFNETEYGFAFKICGKNSCYDCKFKGNNRQGDIMAGDFWGAVPEDKIWNKQGVSVIFAETEKGNDYVLKLKDVVLEKIDFARAVRKNAMLIGMRKRDPRRAEFLKMLEDKGLQYAFKHAVPFKQKIKSYIPQKALKTARAAWRVIRKV